MKIIVTGHAGFIGFHTVKNLLTRGDSVCGIDCLNSYYDPSLKKARLEILKRVADENKSEYRSEILNIADKEALMKVVASFKPDRVINLAAQAGVRHSIEHPEDYVESNLVGFANLLEACRHNGNPHLTYASTSSVYGANTKMPFSEKDTVDHPLQFYAATKRANELMAHSYSSLFGLPTTGLRFFTVYGPWGRPDMALFLFTKNILEGRPIKVFNNGEHTRDFTYVEDIAQGIIRASDQVPEENPAWDSDHPTLGESKAPFRIFNIGNNSPVSLMEYIHAIENALLKKAVIEYLPLQPGDVPDTYADSSKLLQAVGYKPDTTIEKGVNAFVNWYRSYYHV